MDKRTIHNLIIPAEGYAEIMESAVLPYLAERKTEKYCEREQGKKIFYLRCLADQPQGIVILSHGYTETADKHLENIYYFLRGGYHVFMPEHCGHGRSYRLCSDTGDLSLVHIDDYQRYVDDLLFVSRLAAQEFPELPICLYGHSMGGGIAACAAAQEPRIFQAEYETYVSKKVQERFVKKLCRRKNIDAKLIRVKGSKHEIFNSDNKILESYWQKILS